MQNTARRRHEDSCNLVTRSKQPLVCRRRCIAMIRSVINIVIHLCRCCTQHHLSLQYNEVTWYKRLSER